MTSRKTFTLFLIALFISILLIVFSRFGLLTSFTNFFSKITYPVQKSLYSAFGSVLDRSDSKEIERLTIENLELNKKLADQEKLRADISALRDQFAVSNPSPPNLLEAKILSFPSFIPNVSIPETLVIDKGLDDNLKIGQAVIVKDNLIGKIAKITSNKAVVYLITHPKVTFTSEILGSNTEGIIKGLGAGEMILDNVLLSDTLSSDDLVITKGDLELDGVGFPAGLIVGKVSSVNKDPSALFQTAGVESLVKSHKLKTVFVYIESN